MPVNGGQRVYRAGGDQTFIASAISSRTLLKSSSRSVSVPSASAGSSKDRFVRVAAPGQIRGARAVADNDQMTHWHSAQELLNRAWPLGLQIDSGLGHGDRQFEVVSRRTRRFFRWLAFALFSDD